MALLPIQFNKVVGYCVIPLTITTDKGKKSADDEIIKYNNLPISILEIGQLLLKLWVNEDKLYPPSKGRLGAKMSKN